MALLDADADVALVRIRDLAGRTRGTGFLADHDGTVVTSHEAVDGAERLVLQPMVQSPDAGAGATAWTRPVEPGAITPLPETGLALVRTDALRPHGLVPLPIAAGRPAAGTAARLWAGGWLDGTVVGPGRDVTYTATDRVHLLDETLELGLCAGGREALRLGGPAVGGPVLDARTGVVLGVLGTALHGGRRAGGHAIGLRAVAEAAPRSPLAALLERNAATVPAYGSELNPAGALRLTLLTAEAAGWLPRNPVPVERPELTAEFTRFAEGEGTAPVLGLVGDPGTGRSTELARLTERRATGPHPAPTVRLCGAELRADDDGLRTAVGRALRSAGLTLAASGRTAGDPTDLTPDAVARLAAAAGRPLLVLLDA
ncbi:trypsin-like peptidase domain-containing protein, partial [Streptomyces lydicus]|uniref:trypsin-like peptidase domain-containing protein n=2 Tax=Streptomyces lydicus TaxID=47763 RepID=UPI003316B619